MDDELPEWSIPVSFCFGVKFGDTQVSFSEVKGIDVSMKVDPIRSGGDSFNCYYLPKSREYSDLVLSRGILRKDDAFFTWCHETLVGGAQKDCIKLKDLIVFLMDEDHDPIKSWNFFDAYPVKWSLSDFNAMKNEIVVESVSIKYSSFVVLEEKKCRSK